MTVGGKVKFLTLQREKPTEMRFKRRHHLFFRGEQ
jgi:hypothetical protein